MFDLLCRDPVKGVDEPNLEAARSFGGFPRHLPCNPHDWRCTKGQQGVGRIVHDYVVGYVVDLGGSFDE